ncbi:MAG TPA: hypothetical protein VMF69_01675 [Gemmataceae bacterium]|nr:hypothetical protein [Gemmataceae bacterium]
MMATTNNAGGTRTFLLVSVSLCPLVSLSHAQEPEVLPPPREEMRMQSRELPPASPIAPPLPAVPTVPAAPPIEAVLRAGETVTLRIRQVVPPDGLSPGERLLNSRNPILTGDRFLAEVVQPPFHPPALVGGTVTKVTPPGWFGRPGYVTLQLSQLVETVDGASHPLPWRIDLADRRAATQTRRALLTALFGLEGAILGASIGFQNPNSPAVGAVVAGGAGGGLLLGLGYASFQRGLEASLEQGDTFRIVVGTMSYQPVPRDLQTILYPASDPSSKRKKP